MNIDTSKIQEILGSDQVKSLLPYLLAGTGGAVLGGAMTGGRREGEDESRMSHLGRILRNAAITGGLAAGSTALIRKGLDSTYGAVDKANPVTGSAGNEGPASTLARSIAFSPLTAGVSGAAGLAATSRFPGMGNGSKRRTDNLGLLAKALGVDSTALGEMAPDVVHKKITDAQAPRNVTANGATTRVTPKFDIPLNTLRGRAGIPFAGDSRAHRILSRIANTGPMKTFGTTTGRRIGRGALGLAAAGLPALIGALATNDPESK